MIFIGKITNKILVIVFVEKGIGYFNGSWHGRHNYKIIEWEIEDDMRNEIKKIQKQIERQQEQAQQELNELQNKLKKLKLQEKEEKINKINEDIGTVIENSINKIEKNTVYKKKFGIEYLSHNDSAVSSFKREGNKIICEYYIKDYSYNAIGGKIIGIGEAKCDLNDKFNYYDGMNLATFRAMSNYYKKLANEYAKQL